MKAYRYDENGIFLAIEKAFLDPVASGRAGESVYLLPANATFIAPPNTENGYVAVWNGEAWEIKEDNRGKEYWLPGDTYNSPARAMTTVGACPEGAMFDRPAPSLEEVKADKLSEIKDWTAAAITGGFVSGGVRYDSDADTQLTMQGICLVVDLPQFTEEYPQGCPVRGYAPGSDTKTIHMLDAAAVKLFCADLAAHIGSCKQHGWHLQQAVQTAETVEEVMAIIWEG